LLSIKIKIFFITLKFVKIIEKDPLKKGGVLYWSMKVLEA
jgi:hypothetical protein